MFGMTVFIYLNAVNGLAQMEGPEVPTRYQILRELISMLPSFSAGFHSLVQMCLFPLER